MKVMKKEEVTLVLIWVAGVMVLIDIVNFGKFIITGETDESAIWMGSLSMMLTLMLMAVLAIGIRKGVVE